MRRVILTICRRELRASWRQRTAALIAITLATSTVSASVAFAQRLADGVDADAARSVEGADVVVRQQASLPTPLGEQRARLGAAVVEVVRAVPGVGGATPQVEGPVRLATVDGRAIGAGGTLAANWPDQPFAGRWTIVTGAPPHAADEVAVIVDDVVRGHDGGHVDGSLRVGDVVTVTGNGGSQPLRVSGLVRDGHDPGPGRLAALLALPTAQRLVGQTEEVDQVRVVSQPGTTPAELADQLTAALPVGVEARPAATVAAEARAQASEELRLVWAVLASVAGLTVLSGGFVVTNTVRVGAAERRAELALLRLVGASRRQLRRLVLADAAAIGLLGAVAGTALGLAVSAAPARLARAAGWELPATVAGGERRGLGLREGFGGLGGDRWALGWTLALSVAVGALPAVLAALGPATRRGTGVAVGRAPGR